MRSWDQTRQWLARQTGERVRGRTLLELTGRERLVIEGHRGIQCYGTEEIQVRTGYGWVRVIGTGLKLCCMSREQLCVMGSIDEIKLMGRSSGGAVE